jgi:hypothetical protein
MEVTLGHPQAPGSRITQVDRRIHWGRHGLSGRDASFAFLLCQGKGGGALDTVGLPGQRPCGTHSQSALERATFPWAEAARGSSCRNIKRLIQIPPMALLQSTV